MAQSLLLFNDLRWTRDGVGHLAKIIDIDQTDALHSDVDQGKD